MRQNTSRTSIAVLVLLALLLGGLMTVRESHAKKKHNDTIMRDIELATLGIRYLPRKLLRPSSDSPGMNSWRFAASVLIPWSDADKERGNFYLPWHSEELAYWDDEFNYIFCLENLDNLPREGRYTRLMTVLGVDSAFTFMAEHGYEELLSVAHDTIVVVEVTNSSVPWMRAGDLNIDKMPHEINPSNDLGIGCFLGYRQFGVGFIDGSVWLLDVSVPYEALEKFLTVEGARKFERDEVLGSYAIRKVGVGSH